MSIAYSPKNVSQGLVVNLDFGSSKSWKGQPTTNLLSNPWCNDGNSPTPMNFNGYETSNTVVSSLPGGSAMSDLSPYWVKVVRTDGQTYSGRIMFLGLSGLSTGVNYVFSFYVYSSDARLTNLFPGTDNGAVTPVTAYTQYTSSDLGRVKRIYCVFNSLTGGQVIGIRMINNAAGSVTAYLSGFQVERQDAMTPVAIGTRSSSQCSLDLMRNYTATLTGTNFTYPGSGLKINDVNDSYVDITPASGLRMGTNDFTIGAWVSQSDTGYNIVTEGRGTGLLGYIFVLNYPSSGQMSLFLNKDGTQNVYSVTPSPALQTNTPQYVAAVARRNSGRVSFYVNGVLAGEVTNVHFTSISPSGGDIHRLGYDLGGTTTNMTFYSYHVYNRALSNVEVLQNFNAQKGRFGI